MNNDFSKNINDNVTIGINSSGKAATSNDDDQLTQLLSLPVNFSVDPLIASPISTTSTASPASDIRSSVGSPTATSVSRKRSISPCKSARAKRQLADSVVTLKKSRVTLDDKDQKTKERILRNRAAAQESRDKKRRYIAELEDNNKRLLNENDQMHKRVQTLEEQNALLQAQLDAFARQLSSLQTMQQLQQQHQHIDAPVNPSIASTANSKFNAVTPILFNDFCDSARIAKKEGLSNYGNLLLVVTASRRR